MYLNYLQNIFGDLLKLYNFYSNQISEGTKQGVANSVIKSMKGVRRDILRLIQTYLLKEED